MEIETFEATEVTEQTIESSEEQIKLINELCLEGQQSLFDKDPQSATEINPYPLMTKIETVVYGAVLGQLTRVQDYKGEAIPVRVLQVLAHAKQFTDMREFFIVHEPTVDMDDPVLIGVGEHFWGSLSDTSARVWLLARWGKTLEPFPKLQEMAKKIIRENLIETYLKAKKELEVRIELLENGSMNPFSHRDTISVK